MRSFSVTKTMFGAAAAVLAVACSANNANPPVSPQLSSSNGITVRPAHQPRFLHEYTLPLGAYPSSIVQGSDGAMWFGDYPYFTYHQATHLGIGRITLTGKQRYFQFGNGVYDVALGADGNVWFTNPYTSGQYTVGSITPKGKVTQYRVPGIGSPESIAADASRHLWYTAFGGNPDIVEIDTGGKTISTFKALSGYADKVAYGPTGRIWYNGVANPVFVGLVTRRGAQHESPIGGPNYIPGPMVLGPDGRMWSCDGDMLAAIDRSFKVTLYSLPSGGGFADVTAGPDGNLWATDFNHSAIVRVTTSGGMTEYLTPTPNMIPAAIAVGPNGNIWFTEIQRQTDVSKIGVLKP
jgi:virginiamycin B lyase